MLICLRAMVASVEGGGPGRHPPITVTADSPDFSDLPTICLSKQAEFFTEVALFTDNTPRA